MFGIVLNCALIGDLCLVEMDSDDDVVCIEAPVASTASTPHRVKRNGGAVRVRVNGEGSKAASSLGRSGKFKKQGRAPPQYVRQKDLLCADMRLAAAPNLTPKILSLIFTHLLAI